MRKTAICGTSQRENPSGSTFKYYPEGSSFAMLVSSRCGLYYSSRLVSSRRGLYLLVAACRDHSTTLRYPPLHLTTLSRPRHIERSEAEHYWRPSQFLTKLGMAKMLFSHPQCVLLYLALSQYALIIAATTHLHPAAPSFAPRDTSVCTPWYSYLHPAALPVTSVIPYICTPWESPYLPLL